MLAIFDSCLLIYLQIAAALPSKTIPLTSAGKTQRRHARSRKRKANSTLRSPVAPKKTQRGPPTAPSSPTLGPLAALSVGKALSLSSLAPAVILHHLRCSTVY